MAQVADYLVDHELERFLFHKGESFKSYEFFGSHILANGDVAFSVWAPNAAHVSVIGDFNNWNAKDFEMKKVSSEGIYMIVIEGVKEGDSYKYEIISKSGQKLLKSDPYAFFSEVRPKTASKVHRLDKHTWRDGTWIGKRKRKNHLTKPINIYELHLGSWMKKPDGTFNSYLELIDLLVPYLKDHHYTHIELLPLSEHPFDGSWGYQTTGYFAATSRYGEPDMLMQLIDDLHKHEIGVLFDWVPCHFCRDAHGLYYFDGGHVYESAYEFVATNDQWGTNNFDFSRKEIWSFLISNALFWFDKYHIDGLRVDAVAFMLYLDYGKDSGIIVNEFGGKENLFAIDFIKRLNQEVLERFPGVLMIAEESTAWPKVTWPEQDDGLGFTFKWNMGWMNDTLKYFASDYQNRIKRHQLLTFSMTYAFSENYVLPFSHDEMVHGKKSLIGRMPGDYWQKFANLRLLMGWQVGHPGKKLAFMGTELGHFIEWDYKRELDWFLLKYDAHALHDQYIKALNSFYLQNPALYEVDNSYDGFNWIDCDNHMQGVIIFERKGKRRLDDLLIVMNFTPNVYHDYKVGVNKRGLYEEVFNSDHSEFGGSGILNTEGMKVTHDPWQRGKYSITLQVPPLGFSILKNTKMR